VKLIFDGDCAFCAKSSLFGQKRLRNSGSISIVAWQSIADLAEFGLTREQVEKRVYFIADKGQAFGGAQALGKFAQHMKFPWSVLGFLLSKKPVAVLVEPFYLLVARNRHKLPGATDACKIDIGEQEKAPLKKEFLGLRVFTPKDILNKLALQHPHFLERDLSYSEVGATKGNPPAGYNFDTYSLKIGEGQKDFELAVEGFKAWKSHNGGGLHAYPIEMEFVAGNSATFGYVVGPVVILIPDRIVFAEQTDTKFECAYGSIVGHPEKGEEVFRIQLNDDGEVVMEIECFSNIVAPGVKLVYPIARFLQKRVTRKYMTALRDHVGISKLQI